MTYELGDLVARMKLDATEFRQGLATLVGTGGGSAPIFNVLKQEVTGLNQAFWQLQRDAQSMSTMGYELAAAFAIPTAAITTSVKTYGDFDQQMSRSLAIMGDVSTEMRENMANSARTMADQTIYSAKESAQAYYYLGSAGLSAADSIAALPITAKFAQAGHMELKRATEVLTQSQTALGLAVRDDATENMQNMVRVADVLVKADTSANASTLEFAESLTNRGASALRLYHKSVEEGVAVLAAWAEQGIKGSMAGYWLNIVLRDLQTQAIKHPETFKKLGIAVFDASGNMRNMADIIRDLEKRFDGLSDKQVRSELRMLGFQDRSVIALQSLIGMSEEIRRFQTEFERAGGTVDNVSKRQITNMNDQLSILWHRVQDVMMAFGEPLANKIRDMATGFNDGASGASSLRKTLDDLPGPLQTVIGLGSALTVGLGLSASTILILGANALRAAASIQYLGGMSVVVSGLTTAIGTLGLSLVALTGIGLAAWAVKIEADLIKALNAANHAGRMNNQDYLTSLFATPFVATGEVFGKIGMAGMKMFGLGPVTPLKVPGAPAIAGRTADEMMSKPSNIRTVGNQLDEEEENNKKSWSTLGMVDYTTKIRDMKSAIDDIGLAGEQRFKALEKLRDVLYDAFNAGAVSASTFEKELSRVDSQMEATGHVFRKTFDNTTLVKPFTDLDKGAKAYGEMTKEVKRLTNGYAEFQTLIPPFLGAMDGVYIKTDAINKVLDIANEEWLKNGTVIGELETIYKRYGITSQSTLNSLARQAEIDYEKVRSTASSATQDVQRMWINMIEAQIRAGQKLPKETLDRYRQVKAETQDMLDQMETMWGQFSQAVHDGFRNLSRDIARNIVEWKGWGHSLLNIGKTVATDFLAIMIKQMIKPLEEEVAKLAIWIGKKLATAFGIKVAGTATDVATGTAGAAGAVGSAAGSVGSAAGSAGGAVAGGAAGWITAGASIVSAVSGIIGNFQNARQENTLNAVEYNTRISAIYLGQGDSLLANIKDIANQLRDFFKGGIGFSGLINILTGSGAGGSGLPYGASTGGFNFINCVFGANSEAEVVRRMRLAGGRF